MKAIFSTILLYSYFTLIVLGQEVLTLAEASQLAIENNYSLKLIENNILVAQNNATKENNGYNPVVDLSVGPSATFGGSRQRFSNEQIAEANNAFSWGAGATLSTGYTLINKQRDYNLEQLKEVLNLANLQLRQSIENTLIQVYNQYYQIAQLSENIKALDESIKVTNRRLERALVRFELSQGNRIDILNAEVDQKRDSVNLINTREQIATAKRNLNYILGRDVNAPFNTEDGITLNSTLNRDELITMSHAQNIDVLISDQNQRVNDYDLKIIDAGGRPTVGANANLNYNYQKNAPGSFIINSRSQGLNLGLTLNWNLLDGGRRNIQKQNALINIENEAITREDLKLQLERDINNSWGEYQNALYVIDVEKTSVDIAGLNLERTQELFNRGQVSSVEFRQAQLNELNALISLNNAKYAARLHELQLIYLSGGLLGMQL